MEKDELLSILVPTIEFDKETNEFFEHAYKDFLEGKYILEGESKYPRRYENINQIEISDEERNKFLEKCGIKVEE
ncbi:putative S-adenosyl-l-methionine hydroxide adenosyltransferase [Campylobacter phage F336]|uniref:Putative S-adenosyl-l-methionine hydroxide adenosyltransferase n=1 Tax=Campylobacter phage F336 TaxID=2794361 RepID=A0A7T3N3U5_9CAUD|nr:putative S-adenosyl-l-methionine hydroxide adenosyltransferase [Campylobacter phage F336]